MDIKNILITNDDGINSEGLHFLEKALSSIGNVYIVAPAEEVSACSHAITLSKEIKVEKLRDNVYVVHGTPVDCVNIAYYKIIKDIELVVSGINRTPNLGSDIIYSGTVAASAEAAQHNIKALAISLVSNKKKPDYKIAADFSKYISLNIIKRRLNLPSNTFLNINIPDFKNRQIKGIAITTLGRRKYKEDILIKKEENNQDDVFMYHQRSFSLIDSEFVDGTDINAIYKNCQISITPIKLKMTNYKLINSLKSYRYEEFFNKNYNNI